MGLLSWLGKTWESVTPWDEEAQRKKQAQQAAQARPVVTQPPQSQFGAPTVRLQAQGGAVPQMNIQNNRQVIQPMPLTINPMPQPTMTGRLSNASPVGGISIDTWNKMTPDVQARLMNSQTKLEQAKANILNPVAIAKDEFKAVGNIARNSVDAVPNAAGAATKEIVRGSADIYNKFATGYDRAEAQRRTDALLKNTGIDKWGTGQSTGAKIGSSIGSMAGGIMTMIPKGVIDASGFVGTNLGANKVMQDAAKLDINSPARQAMESVVQQNAVSPREVLVNAGENALNVATVGNGSLATKGLEKAAAPLVGKAIERFVGGQAGKLVAANIAPRAAVAIAKAATPSVIGGAVGGGFGTLDTALDPNASAVDYLKNAATGFGTGTIMGAVQPYAFNAAEKGLVKTADAAQRGVQNVSRAHTEARLNAVANDAQTYNVRPEHLNVTNTPVDPKAVQAATKDILNGRVKPVIVVKDSSGMMTPVANHDALAAYQAIQSDWIPTKTISPTRLRMSNEGGFAIVPFGKDKAVNIDKFITDTAPKGVNDRAYIKQALIDKFKGKNLTLSNEENALLSSKGAGKLSGPSFKDQPINDVHTKVNSSMYVDELGATMRNVRTEPNTKSQQLNAPTFLRGDVTILSNGKPYQAELVIKKSVDGTNRIHDVLIKESTPSPRPSAKAADHEVIRGTSSNTLPNNDANVNSKKVRDIQKALEDPDLAPRRRQVLEATLEKEIKRSIVQPKRTVQPKQQRQNHPLSLENSAAMTSRQPADVGAPATRGAMSPPEIVAKTAPEVAQPLRLGKQTEKAGRRSSYTDNSTPKGFNAKEYIDKQTKAQNEARVAGRGDRIGDFKSNLKAKLVDNLSPIEDTLNKSIKETGGSIAPEKHISQQLDRAIRAHDIAGQYIKDNGLADTIQNVKSTKEFDQYLIARHAADLERKGIKTGRNSAADRALIKQLAPEYEAHAKEVTKYTRKMLDTAVDYGLISKDIADALKKEYPNYVPLNRVFSEAETSARYSGPSGGYASKSTQKVVQRIKGSSREIESPLGSIIQKSQDLIKEGEQNRAAQMLAGYRKLEGNPFNLRELAKDEAVGTKSTISYLDKGRVRRFETTPEIAAAAKALNRQEVNVLLKILRIPTRVLRIGATGVNSGFALANLAKDMASAAINSKNAVRTSALNPRVLKKSLKVAGHIGGEYDEFIRQGAGGTRWDIARDAHKQNIKTIRADKNIKSKVAYTVTNPKEWLTAIENTIGRTEELTRAMQYFGTKDTALTKGMSIERAAALAADAARSNTVNFARHGEYGEVLNSVLPYLNAGVQGSRTLIRNFKARPVETAAKIAVLGTMPTLTTTLWNISDPKRKAAYDDIADYEKEGNFIIVPPNPVKDEKTGKWNVIKIPVSQEIANLNNIARNTVESVAGDRGFSAKDTLNDIVGTLTSINGLPIDENGSRKMFNQFTPQALKPGIETLTNQNLFTGNKIVPDSQKNLPAKDQYGDYTSQTAKTLGGLFNVSPRQLDNAWRTSTGGAGQTVLHYADKLLGAGDNARGTSLVDSISGRFSGAKSVPTSDRIEGQFNDLKEQIINSNEYKNASQYDKQRMLNRLQSDISSVEYDKQGLGSGKLTKKQQSLASDGFNVSTYTNLDSKPGGVSINKSIGNDSKSTLDKYKSLDTKQRESWFNQEPDAEYKYQLAKYENDKANGDITSLQDISRQKLIAKARVGSVYPKTVRDLYNLSKEASYQWLTTEEPGIDKQKLGDQLIAYDKALKDAGLTTSLKYKTGVAPSKGGGKKGSTKKSKQAVNISQLNSTIKASFAGKASGAKVATMKPAPKMQQVQLKKYIAKSSMGKSGQRFTVRKGIA